MISASGLAMVGGKASIVGLSIVGAGKDTIFPILVQDESVKE